MNFNFSPRKWNFIFSRESHFLIVDIQEKRITKGKISSYIEYIENL